MKSTTTPILFITLSAALGGLLFGYDTAVISGAIGDLTRYFNLTPIATGWAISSALLGCLLGALISDFCSTRWGRKKAMALAALLFIINSIGTAVPDSFAVFVFFRIVGGIGVGLASMVVPMYIAEIAPAQRRGALVGNYQLAIVFGIVLVYFVNYGIALQGDTHWNLTQGWRWMFGSELIPSVLFFIVIFFIPESPRWLFMQGKKGQAIIVLQTLNGDKDVQKEQDDIQQSLQAAQSQAWKSLLKPEYKRALGVGIGLSLLQQLTGINAILYYAPEIFKSLGSATDASLLETSTLGVVNLIFTLLAIRWVDRKGRKPLLYLGSIGMTLALLSVGLFIYFEWEKTLVLPFLLLFMASFSISWGPIVWVLLAEIFPNSIRSVALAISVFIQWIANFFVTQFFPLMVDNEWITRHFKGAFPFYFFALLCLFSFFFVWKKVPETKHLTLEEMNALWK